MIDTETIIRTELDRLAPDDDQPWLEWADVVRRAHPDNRSATTLRRPRWMVAVLGLLVAIAVAAPAVAFSNGVRRLLNLNFSGPVPASEQVVLSAPIGNGFYAHLITAASTTGGRCELVADDHSATATLPAQGAGGGCSLKGSKPVGLATKALPLVTGLSVGRRVRKGNPANWVPPIVSGNVYPDLHATRVEIAWRTGSHQLTLKNGYFLGGTPNLYMPPFQAFPFYVVAYNAQGHQVARRKLDSPSLLLLPGGWKEYAREYHAWAKTHKH